MSTEYCRAFNVIQAVLTLEEWRFFTHFSLNHGLMCLKWRCSSEELDQNDQTGPFGLSTVQESEEDSLRCRSDGEIREFTRTEEFSLEKCAGIGLLPVPNASSGDNWMVLRGTQGSNAEDRMESSWLELQQVPFKVRRACATDIAPILQMQAHMDPGIHCNLLTYDELEELLTSPSPVGGNLCCSWVAEVADRVVSSVILTPQVLENRFSMAVVGVYPSLEDKLVILRSLWGFIIEYMSHTNALKGCEVSIEQGNLNILGILGHPSDSSPTSVILRFGGSGKFLNYTNFPLTDGLQSDPKSAQNAQAHHHIVTLEELLSVTVGKLERGSKFSHFSKQDEESRVISDTQARRASIVDEVRRITASFDAQTMDENEADTIVQIVMDTVVEYMQAAELVTTSVGVKTSLGDAGLDSLDMLRLAGVLSETLNIALPSTILFDYPTVESLSTYLVAALGISAAFLKDKMREEHVSNIHANKNAVTLHLDECFNRRRSSSLHSKWNSELTALEVQGRRTSVLGTVGTSALLGTQVITIESSSVRFPGVYHDVYHESTLENRVGSKSLFDCMTLTPSGLDAPRTVPLERWDLGDTVDAFQAGRFGSFLSCDIDAWDCQAFAVNAVEAVHMDPQQRLLLECSFENLNAAPITSSVGPVGVHIGASYTEHLQLESLEALTGYSASGGALSVLAGRVSYIYGFTGPCTVTDTACSSALVAMASAHNALRLGQCMYDMTGAINLMLSPQTTAMYAAAGMLTLDGRCKTLDEAADGYVRSEAAAMYLLKLTINGSMHMAREYDSFLYNTEANNGNLAVLSATVNQDGRSSSLTAPNGPAQQTLIVSALKQAHIEAFRVSVLQLHGTGTALGDPIEVHAATKVLSLTSNCSSRALSLQASKSSFGHAEPCAGAVSLTCAITNIQSQAAPPVMHLRTLNGYVSQSLVGNAKFSGVFVSRQSTSICRGEKKNDTFASISSFAFQGTNAHVVIEKAAESEESIMLHLLSASSKMPVVWDRRQHVRGGADVKKPFIQSGTFFPKRSGWYEEVCTFAAVLGNSPGVSCLKDLPELGLGVGIGMVASAAVALHPSIAFYKPMGAMGVHNTPSVPLLLDTTVMHVPHDELSSGYAQCDVGLSSGSVRVTVACREQDGDIVRHCNGRERRVELLSSSLKLSSSMCCSDHKIRADRMQSAHGRVFRKGIPVYIRRSGTNGTWNFPNHFAEVAAYERSFAVPGLSYVLESMLQMRCTTVGRKVNSKTRTRTRERTREGVATQALLFSGNLISGVIGTEKVFLLGHEKACAGSVKDVNSNYVRIHGTVSHTQAPGEVDKLSGHIERKRSNTSHYITSWQVHDPIMVKPVSKIPKIMAPSVPMIQIMSDHRHGQVTNDQQAVDCRLRFDSDAGLEQNGCLNLVEKTASFLQTLQVMSDMSRSCISSDQRTSIHSFSAPLLFNGVNAPGCREKLRWGSHFGFCYSSALRCAYNEDQDLFTRAEEGGVDFAFVHSNQPNPGDVPLASQGTYGHDAYYRATGDFYGRVETAHTVLRPHLLLWVEQNSTPVTQPWSLSDARGTTWAITGGTGGLGSLVVSYLSKDSRNLLIIGRSGRLAQHESLPRCDALLIIHR